VALGDRLPRCSSSVVLPALGGETMRPRWPLPPGDDVDDPQADLRALAGELEGLGRVDRDESWKWGSARYFSGSMPPAFVTSTSTRATVATIAGEAFDLRAVAQTGVPCHDIRDHHVLALR